MAGEPRVLMLIETYPAPNKPAYSGAAAQLRALAPRLQAAGVAVEVLTSRAGPHDIQDELDGIRVTRLAVPSAETRSARLAQRVPLWLARHRRDWDIVHIHGMTRTALAALAAARVLKKPSVLKFTLLGNDDPLTVRGSRFSGAKMGLLRLADAYAAPSTALAEAVGAAGLPSDRVVRIPNGVDPARFAPADDYERQRLRNDLLQTHGWPEDALIVLFVGAMEHRKGIDVLGQAWVRVVRRVPHARLLLVGPKRGEHGEHGLVLEWRLRNADVAGTAAMAGYSERPEDYCKAADLFVFPSRAEGLPNALIEAQAAGLPCVAAEIEGVTRDVVEEGTTGLIVPQEDPDALAGALAGLLQDQPRRRRMGLAARQRAVELFSLDEVAGRYVQLYARLSE